MEKIKIIHVIGELSIGGAEKLLLDLARKIDKKKFELIVVSLKSGGSLMPDFESIGIRVEIIPKRFKLDWTVINRLTKFFEQEKPDIVHTHLFIGDYWGGRAALRANVPRIVSTKHDILNEGICRNLLGRGIRQKFDRTIAISKATKDFLINKEKIKPKKIAVIYNGIDIPKFYFEDSNILKNDQILFGTVGRLVPEKGHIHLIQAMSLIKKTNWHLQIVGGGPLEKKLKRFVKRKKLENNVQISGTAKDIRPMLEKFDVFVLPSISEGLSLAVIEAGVAGKLVVASSVGGVPEIIRNQATGLLYKTKNLEELVRSLSWVFDHREDCQKMATRLQAETVQRFDINKIVIQYEDLYKGLITA